MTNFEIEYDSIAIGYDNAIKAIKLTKCLSKKQVRQLSNSITLWFLDKKRSLYQKHSI